MTKDGWKWIDENGEDLSKNDLGTDSSWCLDKDKDSWPYTDHESCLNLDREDYNTPLFYGLPCNRTSQHVLCNLSAKDVSSIFAEMNESISLEDFEHREILEDDSDKSNDTLGEFAIIFICVVYCTSRVREIFQQLFALPS